jgi:hypothetical protein
VDLDDHSRAVRITHVASPNDQFIADFRRHRRPPSHGFHKIKPVAGIRRGAGPKVRTFWSTGTLARWARGVRDQFVTVTTEPVEGLCVRRSPGS